MSTEPVRINWTISFSWVTQTWRGGSTEGVFEIEREEWDLLTPTERINRLNDMYDQKVAEHVSGGWQVANADVADPVVGA